MVLWLTVASLPMPTGRQNRLYSGDSNSLVKSLASWNIPPILAQYRSDRLAFVCLTSGRDFLPIVKSLYRVEEVVSSCLTDDHWGRT
jgi:hypothetical protein